MEYDPDNHHYDETAESGKSGYHLTNIDKGIFGEISKIIEETQELVDAAKQKSKIMELVELSDLYGAMQGYLAKYHPMVTMEDVAKMSAITQRAFRNGYRN